MTTNYNTVAAIAAQSAYCQQKDIPLFAPRLTGRCYCCNRNIYEPILHPNGQTTGITVKQAGAEHVTSCPHCHRSFDD